MDGKLVQNLIYRIVRYSGSHIAVYHILVLVVVFFSSFSLHRLFFLPERLSGLASGSLNCADIWMQMPDRQSYAAHASILSLTHTQIPAGKGHPFLRRKKGGRNRISKAVTEKNESRVTHRLPHTRVTVSCDRHEPVIGSGDTLHPNDDRTLSEKMTDHEVSPLAFHLICTKRERRLQTLLWSIKGNTLPARERVSSFAFHPHSHTHTTASHIKR